MNAPIPINIRSRQCLLRNNPAGTQFANHHRISRIACLIAILCISVPTSAKACPPGIFDYGPPCPDYARQVVVCHHGGGSPLLPDENECARAARDMSLIGLTSTVPCGFEPNVLVIQTQFPTDPELLCINTHYQTAFYSAGFPNYWIVEFPQTVNLYAMAAIYDALQVVLSAETNGLGSVDSCYYELNYTSLPDGTWHWIYDYPVPWHTACRQVIWRAYVSVSGTVMPPGDLNCDGVVNSADVTPFVETLISPEFFSGCNPCPADVNGDGATDGSDIQPFVLALAT